MSTPAVFVAASLLIVLEGRYLSFQERADQKTGRIAGRVGGVPPVENLAAVSVQSIDLFVGDSGRPFSRAEVDAEGHFAFEDVPAGRVRLRPLFRLSATERDVSLFPALIVPASVRSGTTLQITMFGKGRPVVGRIVPPAGIKPEKLRVWLTLRPPPARALRGPVALVYSVLTAQALESPIDAEGRFRIEGVREGNYRIGVNVIGDRCTSLVFKGAAEGGYPLVESGHLTIPFIAGGESDNPHDLGSLEFDVKSSTKVGQFAAAAGSPVAVGPMAQKLLATDINRDGNPDIVLTCGGTTEGRPDPRQGYVALLFGDGCGGFKPAQPLIPLGADGLKAAVGDLNGDKRPDIVVIAHDSYTATILLQDERGQFDVDRKTTVAASQGDHPHTHDVAVADVNVDGHLDILTTNADDGNVSVLLGDGAARFGPAEGSPFAAGRHPYEALSLGDLNGDKKLDVVLPDLLGRSVRVLLGDGAGGFSPARGAPFAVGDRPGFVTLGDLDGDTKLDIVATHDDDPIVYVLRGDGRGGFRPTAGSPVELQESVWGAVIADMNADGKNDLVLGAKQQHVLILLGDGAGGFDRDPVVVPVGGKGPGNIAVADVNRDGKLDLITSNFDSGDVSVLLRR